MQYKQYCLEAIVLVVLIWRCFLHLNRPSSTAHIPCHPASPVQRFFSRLSFFYAPTNILFTGYDKFKGRVFRVLRWSGWVVVVAGQPLVEELHQLSSDLLSLEESAKSEMQILHTMGADVCDNPYHLSLLRSRLPRHLNELTEQILDEIGPAFEDHVGRFCSDDWFEFDLCKNIIKVTTRSFNRILVGQPICRNEGYNELCAQYSVSVYAGSIIINLFPPMFHRFIGKLVSQLSWFQKRAFHHLGPLIEERKYLLKDRGSTWLDKPNDILSWLMDEARGEEAGTMALTTRVLAVTAATTHTTSYTLIQALLNLAGRQSYVECLTAEADIAIRSHGLTRAGLDSLMLLDSFFKESMRVNSLGLLTFPRKALKPFTLLDGTHIPQGAMLSASFGVHFDEEYYRDPQRFDGFRFVPQDEARSYNGMAVTSASFLPWGHGRHACPGRFIATYALKALMVHILTNYEIKLGGDGKRKPDFCFTYHCKPNANATIAIRRRFPQ